MQQMIIKMETLFLTTDSSSSDAAGTENKAKTAFI